MYSFARLLSSELGSISHVLCYSIGLADSAQACAIKMIPEVGNLIQTGLTAALDTLRPRLASLTQAREDAYASELQDAHLNTVNGLTKLMEAAQEKIM